MESSNHWHRGRIIGIDECIDDASDTLQYLVAFNFYSNDRNQWVFANELLDDAICGDPRNETIGYGILFLDRKSYFGFGQMESAQLKRLIIMRHCKICRRFFRFIEATLIFLSGVGKKSCTKIMSPT